MINLSKSVTDLWNKEPVNRNYDILVLGDHGLASDSSYSTMVNEPDAIDINSTFQHKGYEDFRS